ncbi:uncharacterized protein LOC126669383 [Mercurialis annua]|uniref:uncharacterized protein LOC126669383 n=1 Tax=Mercurialis annua TaxID=3986 RepID=UPI0021603F0F|nr:uncharacterized protein LOC126669383 [Mercurialis annua]
MKQRSPGRMGSCRSHRKGVWLIDEDGDRIFKTKPKSLDDCLLQISNQNAKSGKEEPLFSIFEALTTAVQTDFAKKNSATLLYHCLLFIKKGKKGSVNESVLAAKIIALLAVIVEDEDNAHEIFQDSVSVLPQFLDNFDVVSEILNCLAVTAVFGSYDTNETQQVMQIIWKFVQVKKHSAAAISAWCFLLSTIEIWDIHHKDWQSAIPFLSNLLEDDDDESVYAAAAEALALIFEINCLEKFAVEAKDKDPDTIKQILMSKKASRWEVVVNEEGETEEEESNEGMEVLEYFESGEFSKTHTKIGKDKILISTWCRKIQLNFIRGVLGEDGFVKHMRQNVNVQAIFEFTPKVKAKNAIASPEREEVTMSIFLPKVERKEEDAFGLPFVTREQKIWKRVNSKAPSFLNKAKTCLMNKRRMVSEGHKYQFFNDD